MVGNRIIFGILWILSVVGISFYGGPVSYGLFFMFTGVFLASLIYIIYVYFSYRIYQEIGTKNPVAKQGVPYYITLQNERWILFCSIRVKFYSSFSEIEGLKDDSEYELGPGDGIRLETRLICRYRGEYEVGVKRIIITDLFRLIRFSFDNPEPLRVVVKPELVSAAPLTHIPDSLRLLETKRDPDIQDVLLRSYEPGDSLKRINWKATARMDQLLVRTDTGEEKQSVLLIPDTCRYSGDEFSYIPAENEILKTVLFVSLYYVRQNIQVILTVPLKNRGCFQTAVNSEKGFQSYYEEVAGISFEEGIHTEALLPDLIKAGSVNNSAILLAVAKDEEEKEESSQKRPGSAAGLCRVIADHPVYRSRIFILPCPFKSQSS